MISKVKRDLLLSVNQPMNSAYLEFIGIHFIWCNSPPPSVGQGLLIPEFLDHTQRRPTVGRTPLDEGSARCRDLYLTTHNTHNKQTSLPPVAFEPTISEGERPQTYALHRAATGTDSLLSIWLQNQNGLKWKVIIFTMTSLYPILEGQFVTSNELSLKMTKIKKCVTSIVYPTKIACYFP